MSGRALVGRVMTVVAVVTLPVLPARAQLPLTARGPVARLPVPPISNVPGNGPFQVVLKSVGGTTSFGNATAVTFQSSAKIVVIQFPADNQMAAAIKQNVCLAQHCPANIKVSFSTSRGPSSYEIEQVQLTQFGAGRGVSATFSYAKVPGYIELTSFSEGATNSTSQGGAAPHGGKVSINELQTSGDSTVPTLSPQVRMPTPTP